MSGREDQPAVKMESELSGVKIVLDDGTEMPAEVVLRDKDADLAFIRPKTKPAAPMAALDLANAGKADVLDQVVTLTRLGSAAGRADSASVERISAIVTKPRLFYVPENERDHDHAGRAGLHAGGQAVGRVCPALR